MKTKAPIRLAVLMIGVALTGGCHTGSDSPPAPAISRIQGVDVIGKISKQTGTHVEEIRHAISDIDKEYPLLSINFKDDKTAEVTTGVVRGPLDGGGRIYIFRQKNGKWITDKSNIVMWFS